jgi:hypothetical protein
MKLSDTKSASPLGFVMFNKDTALISIASSSGKDFIRDSVVAFFDLSRQTMTLVPLNYEDFFPAVGQYNAPRFYHRVMWRDGNTTYGYFNGFPYLYDVGRGKTIQLEGILFNLEENKQGKTNDYFYYHRIQKIGDTYLVIASLEKGKIYALSYTGDFKKLLSKKLLFEGFFKGTYIVGNKVYAMEVYTDKPERKDRAVLHVFEIKQ